MDIWHTKETMKKISDQDKKERLTSRQADCLIAFVWLVIIVPLVMMLKLNSGRLIFLSITFLSLPVSNFIARELEKYLKQKYSEESA
jgi:hypothetical protein